jgi:hypothetical protein
MTDDDECGAVGGMSGRGNRSTRRKPAPVPLCPPQIRHDLMRTRTRAAAVGSPLRKRTVLKGADHSAMFLDRNAWKWKTFQIKAMTPKVMYTDRHVPISLILHRFSPVNYCWTSPAQSFLVSVPVGTYNHIFVFARLSRVLKLGLLSDERRSLTVTDHSPLPPTGEWLCWLSLSLIHLFVFLSLSGSLSFRLSQRSC